MNDLELLRQAKAGDSAAWAALVQRHYGWLYAAARRQVRDPHAAEDVAQAVFIVLMQKPPTLKNESSLSAWLFTVARFAARRAMRSHRRRKFHEGQAAAARAERIEEPAEDAAWKEIQLHLDDAVARLNQTDREAVLLRFYQERTFFEVGSAMGISEEAARKRVERAVARLRNRLSRQRISISAAALGPELLKILGGASAIKVPVIAHAGAGSGMIAQGVIHMIWTTQAKLLAAIVITALATATATTVVVVTIRQPQAPSVAVAPVLQSQSQSTSKPAAIVTQNGAVAPNDLLEINVGDLVANGQTTTLICRVDPQSRVHLPLVKLLSLSGMTLPQAEQRVAKAYETGGYLQNALVAVRRLESGAAASIPYAPIQPGDAVRVEIGELEAVGKTSVFIKPVMVDGKMQLPFVGPVLVKDLTEAQADEAIAKAFEDQGFLKNAIVSVRRISQEEAARPAIASPAPDSKAATLK